MYKSHIHIDAATSRKSWSCSTFAIKLWVVTQSQQRSRVFEHAVAESLSIVAICYHFLLFLFSKDCIFPYFLIKQVDTSHLRLTKHLIRCYLDACVNDPLQSPLPISTAFGKTNFLTLCPFCWITSQIFDIIFQNFRKKFGQIFEVYECNLA